MVIHRRTARAQSPANAGYDYDAFISYNHGSSEKLTGRLHRAIETFAGPWHRAHRALRVFLDRTNMPLTAEARADIGRIIERSAWFILVATPEAAESDWVKYEVGVWLGLGRADRLIIVKAGGRIEWDDQNRGFGPGTTALPQALVEAYARRKNPLWQDLTDATAERGLKRLPFREPANEWKRSVAQISATIQDRPFDDVYGAHRRQRRIARALISTATVLLLALAGLATVQHRQNTDQRRENLAQERGQRSRMFAAVATELRESDPALSRQLSIAAYRAAPTEEARSALLSSTSLARVTRATAHGAKGWGISATADGHTVATAGDGTVVLWDLRQPEKPVHLARLALTTAARIDEPVEGVTLSSNGRRLAATDFDGRIWTWDLTDPGHPRKLATSAPGTRRLGSITFSPDGRTLITVGRDGVLQLWDVDGGLQNAVTFSPGTPGVASTAVAFSADGRTFATGAGTTLRLWRLTKTTAAEPVRSFTDRPSSVGALAFDPDRAVLAVGYGTGAVEIWDVGQPDRPTLATRLTGNRGSVTALGFDPTGTRLLSGGGDHTLITWDTATWVPLRSLPHAQAVAAAVFLGSADEIADVSDEYLRIWHLPGPVLAGEQSAIASVLFRPGDHHTLATGGDPHSVRLWNVSDPHHPRVVARPRTRHTKVVNRMAFRDDGAFLAVPGDDGTVEIWNVSDPGRPQLAGEPLRAHQMPVSGTAFDAGGTLLASASVDRTARLWDVSDPARPSAVGEPLRPPVPDPGVAASAAVSRDGVLAVGNGAGAVMLYDVSDPGTTRELAAPLDASNQPVIGLAWSADDRTLVTAGFDGQVTLWERTRRDQFTASASRVMHSGPDGARSVTFVDANRVAVGNEDGSIWIWDIAAQVPAVVAKLTGPLIPESRNGIFGLDHDPATRLLAGGSQNGSTVLWNLDEEAVIAEICRSVGAPVSKAEWTSNVKGAEYADPCR